MLLCAGMMSSCFDSGKLESDYPVTSSEQLVKHSCGKMNKLANVLDYDSFKWAVVCWGWDLDYPEFYQALLRIGPESWNHVMMPLNQFFFNDFDRRNKYLKWFNQLDQAGALDDFATFLDAITEANFNHLLSRILEQTFWQENSPLTRPMLFKIMDLLRVEQESLVLLERLYKASSLALEGENKNLTLLFQNLVDDKEFEQKRISFIDQVFNFLLDPGFSNFDIEFIKSFLEYRDEEGGHWFHQWIKQLREDPAPLIKLLTYGHNTSSRYGIDFSNLFQLMPFIPCQIDMEEGHLNSERVFQKFITRLANDNVIDFVDFVNKEIIDINWADAICSGEDSFNQKKINISSLISEIVRPMNDRQVYLFLQRFHQNIFEVEKKLSKKRPYYLIDIYSGAISQKAIEFNQYLIESEGLKHLQILANIISSYSKDDYKHFVDFIKIAVKSENLEILKGGATFWKILRSSEKKSLLDIVDVLFKEDVNYIRLLSLFGELVADFKYFVPILSNHLAPNDLVKGKTLWSLYSVAKELRGPKVLIDLRKMFSEKEILKTIRTLAGAVSGRGQVYITPKELGRNVFSPILTLSGQLDQREDIWQCFDYLSKMDKGISALVLRLPEQCQRIESRYFSVKILQVLNRVNNSVEGLNINNPLFSEDGLIGNKAVFGEFIKNILLLKEEKSPFGAEEIVDLFKQLMFTEGASYGGASLRVRALEDFLRLLRYILSDNDPHSEQYIHSLKKHLAKKSDIEIASYVQKFSKILSYYALQRDKRDTFDEKNSCENVFPPPFVVNPCPNKNKIKLTLAKIFPIFAKRYNGKKSLIEIFIEAITPGHGLKIPYLSKNGTKKHINHVIDLQQLLLVSYDSLTHFDTVRLYTGPNNQVDFFDKTASKIEQVETSIRNIELIASHFGLYYFNSVALGWDYVNSSKKVFALFDKISYCLNNTWCDAIKGVFDIISFGQLNFDSLKKQSKFWSLNVVNTSPSLIGLASPYSHQGEIFHHDLFMKSLMALLVQSSNKSAQFTGVFSEMSDHTIDLHSGEVAFRLAEISALKNITRFIYDRLGTDKNKFDQVVFGDELQRVNRNLLRGIQVKPTQKHLQHLFSKYSGQGKELNIIIEKLIDGLSYLSYEQQRRVENVVGDIAIIMSSLGDDKMDIHFKGFGEKYIQNNVFNYVGSLEDLVLIIYNLSGSDFKGNNLFHFFETIGQPVRFLRDGLSTKKMIFEQSENEIATRRKLFYVFINESFQIFNQLMSNSSGVNLFEFLLKKIEKKPQATYDIINKLVRAQPAMSKKKDESKKYLKKDRKLLGDLAKLLHFYSSEGRWSTNNVRNWPISTSDLFANSQQRYEDNKKLINLIDYLLSPLAPDHESTNLYFILQQVFVTNDELLKSYLNEIFTLLNTSGKELNQPYKDP